ncbi:MAG: alpha/beta hydrolase [Burkholderiales bacterium]|nr:alpha/beta hydrolase [Burkholderiales bacterium]
MSNTPTLVLLPGLLCDAAVWAAGTEALAGVRCIVPSYGLADSLPAMAQAVLAALPAGLAGPQGRFGHCGSFDRFSLAGHSMGGRVALELMRLAPERVERFALLDSGLDPLPESEAGERERDGRLALLALARREGMRAMALQWARGMVHPDHVTQPVFEQVVAMVCRSTPEVFERQIHALLARPDARSVFANVHCPTLLACGRQDAWSPLARHEQMQRLLPHATLTVIEDSGHMAPMEQPAAVAAALRTWMACS